MTDTTTTRARHAAVLSTAKNKLDNGDTAGYWQEISKISPDYGRIAGSVAEGDFHGKGARERLQDAAEDQLGRRFTETELDSIENEIAKADQTLRNDNLKDGGDAGISLKDTVTYHARVFEREGLSADTYSLKALADAMGDDAATIKDTAPDFARRNLEIIKDHPGAAADTAISYGIDTLEALGRDAFGLDDNQGAPEVDENDTEKGFGPGAESTSPDQDDNVSEMPGSTSEGAAPAKTKSDISDIISYDNLNDNAKQVFDKLAPEDGFEESVGAVSLKDPADMTDGEAKDLVGAYLDRPIGDPERAALQEKAQAFFDVNYGNEPVSMDETGRMQDIKPIRKLPEKPQPAKTAQGGVLADGLKQIAGAVASAAQNNGSGSAVKSLQTGLNLMGANLKVDGDPGPKTKAATVRTIAKQGPGKAREAHALGALNQYAKSVRDQPSKVADLSSTVQSTIKPLVGDTEAAGRVVQVGINDLVQNKVPSTPSPEPPLKEDGDVGPKTQAAFSSALAKHGPDDLTRSIGQVFDFT